MKTQNRIIETRPAMDFDQWMQFGREQGWCSAPVCQTHEGTPMSDSEHEELWEGLDPCIHIIRLYESAPN